MGPGRLISRSNPLNHIFKIADRIINEKTWFISVIVFIILISIPCLHLNNSSHKEKILLSKRVAHICSDNSLLEPGDIFLCRGDGMVSWAIIKTLKNATTLTHCGIYKGPRQRISDTINSKDCIIHIAGNSTHNKIQSVSITDFLSGSREPSVLIVRLKDHSIGESETSKIRAAIGKSACTYLGRGSSFDYDFDLENDNLYCSELVWLSILKGTGIDIHTGNYTYKNRMIIAPREFTNSEFFTLVFAEKGAPLEMFENGNKLHHVSNKKNDIKSSNQKTVLNEDI